MESLLFPALIVGFLYFFMIAPQRRKMKAHRQLLSSLNEGDEVLTSAGIYGAVAEVEDGVIWLEVAPEVELKVQNRRSSRLFPKPTIQQTTLPMPLMTPTVPTDAP